MGATGRRAAGCSAPACAGVLPACMLMAGDFNDGRRNGNALFALAFHGFECLSFSVCSPSWADSFRSPVLWFSHLGQTT